MLKGAKFVEARDTIASAFDASEFDMFLYEQLDFDRPMQVPDGSFKQVVTSVLKHFQREGREPDLIAEVAALRPRRSDIQRLYKQYGRGLLGEAWNDAFDHREIAALERYRLAPMVDLQRDGRSQIPGFVTAVSDGFQKRVHASLPDVDPWLWATQLLKQMRRVCRIEVDDVPKGTGFLVSPGALLTNYHVLEDVIEAKGAGSCVTCLFDHWMRGDGLETEGARVQLAGAYEDWHVDSSKPLSDAEEAAGVPTPTEDQLDHALVRLERDLGEEPTHQGGPKRGWIRVPETAPTITVGMALSILQHPKSGPVKLAFDTRSVLSINDAKTRVRYATNTDNGSSGAPCFNVQWGLVALHHYGDPDHKTAEYNQGIPIHKIRERLRRKMVEGLLGGDPP